MFADLGYPDADEMRTKAHLVHAIETTIRDRELTQADAARLMGIDQPKVSHLLRGKFRGFSVERLATFVARLGRDVEIVIRPAHRSRSPARVRVVMR